MGEPQTPHFYDSGIFERVPGSRNHSLLFCVTPGYLKKLEKIIGALSKYYFSEFQNIEFQKMLTTLENMGAEKVRRSV